MKRILLTSIFAVGCLIASGPNVQAQVFVRAPFVRVQVGPGVAVRAPFVNFFIPPGPPVYYTPGFYLVPPSPPAPGVGVQVVPGVGPAPAVQAPQPAAPAGQALTLDQFAKTFQAKAGSYDVNLINPVTNQPTRVRFALPEGMPRNIHVRPREIEFRYGLLRFVRIEFDKDGAQVVSR